MGGRVDHLLQDLRFAVRALKRNPAFAAVAVLVLALGIGATTSVFSVVNAVLVRALPYRDPSRLMAVSSTYHAPGQGDRNTPTIVLSDLERWRDASRTVESMGGFAYTELPIRVGSGAFSPVTALVDPEFLPTLGVTLAKGSPFEPRANSARDRTVVISHRLWLDAFNGDLAVIGRAVSVNGEPYSVRGVLPADFQFPRPDASYSTRPVDLLLPAATFEGFPASTRQWFGIVRLRAGVTLTQAQAELGTISREVSDGRTSTAGWSARLDPLGEVTARSSRQALLITLGISFMLLLIASTNVMNLLFSRGVARLREMAIRKAIGCSPGRLVRQLITESAVLTAVAAVVGVLFAAGATNALVALSPVHLPVTQNIGIDGGVLAFTFGITALTALVAGVIPAVHVNFQSDNAIRSPGTRATGGRALARVQQALCVLQMSLGVALLAAAGVLTHSLWRLNATDPGFRSESILGFSLSVPNDHLPEQRRRFYQDALEQVRGIPGVKSAGWITFLPPETRAGVFMGLTIDGAAPLAANAPPRSANHMITSAGYFGTMGIRIARGRDFTDGDDATAPPVTIVNEAFERKYFPRGHALGQHIGTAFDDGKPVRQVVGVVSDTHDRGLAHDAIPTVYIPFPQFALMYGSMAVRTDVAPTSVVPEIRRRLAAVDPAVPLTKFETVRDRIHDSLDEPRFYTVMTVACALMAVLFVSLGLYGIISFSVSRRTSEFGIRMAIGADDRTILRMVLMQGLRMAAAGVTLGVALSIAFGRVLASLLFQVKPVDPITLAGAVGVVVAVTVIASLVPARRASRVSPVAALRYD